MAIGRTMTQKKKASRKIDKVLREFKTGKLKSGSGGKVTGRKQAIAIALSEARKSVRKGK